MFESLSVKQLKTLITEFKAFHDIKGYHRMKKEQLVKELGKRFVLKNGRLHTKDDGDTTEDDDDDAPLLVAPKSKSKPDIFAAVLASAKAIKAKEDAAAKKTAPPPTLAKKTVRRLAPVLVVAPSAASPVFNVAEEPIGVKPSSVRAGAPAVYTSLPAPRSAGEKKHYDTIERMAKFYGSLTSDLNPGLAIGKRKKKKAKSYAKKTVVKEFAKKTVR